jgi:hypothetical protein
MLLKLFHKIEREGMLLNLFYEASVTLILKLNKETHTHTQENYRPIPLMNINSEILNKIFVTWSQQYIKKIIHNWVPEAREYNPSCLEGWDQEDHGSRLAHTSLGDNVVTNSWVQWHAPIVPNDTGGWDQEDVVPCQPRQKNLWDPISKKKLGMVTHICHSSNNRSIK